MKNGFFCNNCGGHFWGVGDENDCPDCGQSASMVEPPEHCSHAGGCVGNPHTGCEYCPAYPKKKEVENEEN